MNITNFQNVDKPRGGGSDNVDKVFWLNICPFCCFFDHLNTCLVVFSLYLAIIKKKVKKK